MIEQDGRIMLKEAMLKEAANYAKNTLKLVHFQIF